MTGAGGGGPVLLGVRHHGPGSARAVRAALEQCAPRAVLIEGPPEADDLVALAAHPRMRPPVALLAHAVDDPGRAAFWPLAAFSPEWVALRWALAHDVPVRFVDLPAAHVLALPDEDRDGERDDEDRDDEDQGVGPGAGAGAGDAGGADEAAGKPAGAAAAGAVRLDPLRALAEAAGHDDPERWWEDVVEHRRAPRDGADALAPFAALAAAMAELRTAYGAGGHPRDLLREAHMRLRLRAAQKEFGDRVAVVCGAWHVPALDLPRTRSRTGAHPTAAADRRLLTGLPKVKTALTWVPWTHRRLARRSGYGAGIASPGWYGHLFEAPDRPVERWLTKAARLLREADYPVSSAHVIEAVRLAEGLAAVRGRPLAGLAELDDAVRAVMADGSDVPAALIRDRLVVGEVLGRVPEDAPAVPLQRDLARCQRTLRLTPEPAERDVELDLRKETDAGRSRLLHRLRLLGVPWGEPVRSRGGTGTFRETWRLRWEPELSVRVAEAGVWGTTVLAAATAKARAHAAEATVLAEATALAERCLLAALPEALPVVLRALADRAALDADVGHLARALPALVRSVRYGDVRGTDAGALRDVALGLAERIFVGLPPACTGLGADGAAEARGHLDATHRAVGLLGQVPTGAGTPTSGAGGVRTASGTVGASEAGGVAETSLWARWSAVLRTLAERDAVPGLLRGRAARLLLDDGRLPDDGAERLMALALSPGTPPVDAAGWIEGFVGGRDGGLLLLHDERLRALLDGWLTHVPAAAFTDVLPLLRRTFAEYDTGVRRTLGELVRRGPAAGPDRPAAGPADAAAPGFGPGLDRDRAAAVLPTLQLLLGTPRPGRAQNTDDTDDGEAMADGEGMEDTVDGGDMAGGARGGADGAGAGGGRGERGAEREGGSGAAWRRANELTGAGR
ncbi:DUF5682 family protein [Streptomyces lunalinharesii]|uniref:DUF5682 family protein n=1 Tax=Streptomyces lunalinharesii TaxID=333384 RepID=A0ABP6EGR1_9ACTN